MLEFALLVFLIAVGGVGANLLRRPDARPIAYWTWGGFALLASGICLILIRDMAGWSVPVGLALVTSYPVLLLVGAMVFAGHRRPRGWVGAALLVGLFRGLMEQQGYHVSQTLLGDAIGTTAAVAAAVLTHRATRDRPRSWQVALAPAFLGLAALIVTSVAWAIFGSGNVPMPLIGAWIIGASLVLALQIAAVVDRHSEDMERMRHVLEEEVRERTLELARSVTELEGEISERRAAENASRESEERYRMLSELSSDYSFSVRIGPSRRIEFEWASGALSRITGYEISELDGRGWLVLFDEPDRDEVAGQLAAVLGGESREIRARILSKQHEHRWIHVLFHTVLDEEGGLVRMIGSVRDVTANHRAEEERHRLDVHMREVQRLESLGVMAGGIAHDFNNMLAAIRGNSRLALADLDVGKEPRDRLERIRSAAEHATALTDQMLTYAGRTPVELRCLDLSKIVRDAEHLLRASVGGKGDLEFDLASDLPDVEGDVTRIQQILVNLVSNAGEALGEAGGTVCVSTGRREVDADCLSDGFGASDAGPGPYVYVEVSDTGRGMDPDVRERVFEPFFTTRASGRGLGLAAVLGIVSSHHGVIRIQSELGEGTEFQVLFPHAPHPVMSEPRLTDVAKPVKGGILVVDDDEAVLELAREFLERAGFDVLAAESGRAGVALLRDRKDEIAAVVLDLVMPGMGGGEAMLEMLRIRPELPVIVTSGYDKENVAERLKSREISGFLYKPYEAEDLVESVRKAVTDSP